MEAARLEPALRHGDDHGLAWAGTANPKECHAETNVDAPFLSQAGAQ